LVLDCAGIGGISAEIRPVWVELAGWIGRGCAGVLWWQASFALNLGNSSLYSVTPCQLAAGFELW
jgi:hypothetical protein